MEYFVDYGTGEGNEHITGALEDAMKVADAHCGFTQCDITIYGESNDVVAARYWWGYEPTAEEASWDIIQFGSQGFFAPWVIV